MFGIHEHRLASLIVGAGAALPEPSPGLWHLGRKLVGYELFLTLRRGVLADPALLSVILRQAQGRAALLSPRLRPLKRSGSGEAGIPLLPVAEVVAVTDANGARLMSRRSCVCSGEARAALRSGVPEVSSLSTGASSMSGATLRPAPSPRAAHLNGYDDEDERVRAEMAPLSVRCLARAKGH